MFVTQKEIEARLASDDNLLNSLLIGRPSDQEELPSEIRRDEVVDSESLEQSNDETASANTSNSDSVNFILPRHNISNGFNSCDNDVKLGRILDGSDFEQTLINKSGRSGRPNGAADRTTEQRADIALMGTVLGHGLAADLLGISTASSSLHARGKVSHTDDEIDLDLDKTVKRKLHKIRNKSADALIKVLDLADTNQMYDAIKTAKDAVFVANQLANVVQKVQPQEQEQKPTAQFVIIQPTVRTVEQYEVINV